MLNLIPLSCSSTHVPHPGLQRRSTTICLSSRLKRVNVCQPSSVSHHHVRCGVTKGGGGGPYDLGAWLPGDARSRHVLRTERGEALPPYIVAFRKWDSPNLSLMLDSRSLSCLKEYFTYTLHASRHTSNANSTHRAGGNVSASLFFPLIAEPDGRKDVCAEMALAGLNLLPGRRRRHRNGSVTQI